MVVQERHRVLLVKALFRLEELVVFQLFVIELIALRHDRMLALLLLPLEDGSLGGEIEGPIRNVDLRRVELCD